MEAMEEERRIQQEQDMKLEHTKTSLFQDSEETAENQEPQVAQFIRGEKKVGRNEACPCGSGKKYKQCHGKLK
jgi:preprotein translocase subunit SecA